MLQPGTGITLTGSLLKIAHNTEVLEQIFPIRSHITSWTESLCVQLCSVTWSYCIRLHSALFPVLVPPKCRLALRQTFACPYGFPYYQTLKQKHSVLYRRLRVHITVLASRLSDPQAKALTFWLKLSTKWTNGDVNAMVWEFLLNVLLISYSRREGVSCF